MLRDVTPSTPLYRKPRVGTTCTISTSVTIEPNPDVVGDLVVSH